MNEKENKQQLNKPSEAIEDLTVKEADAEEVKGGPNWPSVKMLDSVIGVDTDMTPNPGYNPYITVDYVEEIRK